MSRKLASPKRRTLLAAALATCLMGGFSVNATAAELDKVHFLIPGGAGGGSEPWRPPSVVSE